MKKNYDPLLNPNQKELMGNLTTPAKIQEFLDSIPYSPENRNRCPLEVLRDKKAHCLDGALFAVFALRQLGYPPLVVDLIPEPDTDDDHMLAIFKRHDRIGAIAKSNYTGLRFREPVYRNVRELVMSYFADFYNKYGQKTLRAYSRPVNMTRFDKLDWTWNNAGLDEIEHYFLHLPHISLISPKTVRELSIVDKRSLTAGLLGSDPKGLYQPKNK
jgi:hypothetical protein